MKFIFLSVLFWTLTAGAQIRLIGTNTLVDISAALKSGPHGSYSNYWLVGKVERIEGKLAFVGLDLGEIRYVYDPPRWKQYGDMKDTVSMAAASRMNPSNGISAGQFFSLSRGMKENYSPRRIHDQVMVKHPPANLTLNADFKECVLPLGATRVIGIGDGRGFDCGLPFNDPVTTNYQCFVAHPTGLVRVKGFSPAKTP